MYTIRMTLGIVAGMLVAVVPPVSAQYHERREAKVADSGAIQNVKGGFTFQTMTPYDKAYESALNYLKRNSYTIDTASAETGQIATVIEVKGGYRQTGTRVLVTCIKDSDTQTSVRVVVTEQKRTKLLQTEPWGDAKANESESAKIGGQIKAAVDGKRLANPS